MKRKHAAIDIMKLYTEGDTQKWNQFLWTCLKKKDVKRLTKTLYGLQAGMTDLANQNMNSDKIDNWFIRMQRSIEKTLKEIYREEFDNPLYNPANKNMYNQHIEDKKQKDKNLESFLKDHRF